MRWRNMKCTPLAKQNIFDFGGVVLQGAGGLHFFGRGQFILRPFSHFEMQDFKISKTFACGTRNIHTFTFKIHAGFQVDIDFNTESNFLVQGAVSFHHSVGTQNQPNP